VHMALAPLLVEGEERGRLKGKHRERCQQCVWSSNISLARAVIRDVLQAVSHQAKECISREMFPCFGSNKGHGKPPHENLRSSTSGGILALMFTKGQSR
jgi:hypothetical protein